MWKGKDRSRNGFGLIEVIVCLLLLGILVPLLVFALNKSSTVASNSLSSVDMVTALRRVDEELALLGSGSEQRLLRGSTEAGESLLLSYSEGKDIEMMDEAAFQEGVHHLNDAYAIKLSFHDSGEEGDFESLQRVVVELSNPIQAPYKNRKKKEFVRLFSSK